MASVLVNRLSSGQFGATMQAIASAKNQFLGYADGLQRLGQLGNNGEEYCERARQVVEVLNYIQSNGPSTNILYWRGVHQGGQLRAFRIGDVRAANTDFMVGNPKSAAYRLLDYWGQQGSWVTPGGRR